MVTAPRWSHNGEGGGAAVALPLQRWLRRGGARLAKVPRWGRTSECGISDQGDTAEAKQWRRWRLQPRWSRWWYFHGDVAAENGVQPRQRRDCDCDDGDGGAAAPVTLAVTTCAEAMLAVS